MKICWRVLITIGLAVLCSRWVQLCGAPIPTTGALSVSQLRQAYEEFNEEYFANSLPKDTVVDYGEYDFNDMASTQRLPDRRFHIALNESYTGGARVARLMILHEDCHIKTWLQEPAKHGKLWRSCMLQLDLQGAFREQLIDGYREH